MASFQTFAQDIQDILIKFPFGVGFSGVVCDSNRCSDGITVGYNEYWRQEIPYMAGRYICVYTQSWTGYYRFKFKILDKGSSCLTFKGVFWNPYISSWQLNGISFEGKGFLYNVPSEHADHFYNDCNNALSTH